MGAVMASTCNHCGTVTALGRWDLLGRWQCEVCEERWWAAGRPVQVSHEGATGPRAGQAEAERLAEVAAEVAEREAMLGLTHPPTA